VIKLTVNYRAPRSRDGHDGNPKELKLTVFLRVPRSRSYPFSARQAPILDLNGLKRPQVDSMIHFD
jgi:hypothetical protein